MSEERPKGEDESPPAPLLEVDSRDILQGQREVFIRHGEELYRLQVTPNGKLIMRK